MMLPRCARVPLERQLMGNQSGSCLPTLQHQAEAPPRLEMVLELGLSDWGSGFAGG